MDMGVFGGEGHMTRSKQKLKYSRSKIGGRILGPVVGLVVVEVGGVPPGAREVDEAVETTGGLDTSPDEELIRVVLSVK